MTDKIFEVKAYSGELGIWPNPRLEGLIGVEIQFGVHIPGYVKLFGIFGPS